MAITIRASTHTSPTPSSEWPRGTEIRKRAWCDDVSYEKAAADLLHDAAIERIVEHDMAISRKQRFDEEEAG
jgi:hypothetical protein